MHRALLGDALGDVHLGPQAAHAHVGRVGRDGDAALAAQAGTRGQREAQSEIATATAITIPAPGTPAPPWLTCVPAPGRPGQAGTPWLRNTRRFPAGGGRGGDGGAEHSVVTRRGGEEP